MENAAYILITLIALVVLALVFLLKNKKEHKPISGLVAASLLLIIAGIILGESKIFYGLITIGLILASIDIIKKSKK